MAKDERNGEHIAASSSVTEDPERRDFFQRLYSLHEQLG